VKLTVPQDTQIVSVYTSDKEEYYTLAKVVEDYLCFYEDGEWKQGDWSVGLLKYISNYWLVDKESQLPKQSGFKGYANLVGVQGSEITLELPKTSLEVVNTSQKDTPKAKDASSLCLRASELLAERGKQYDGSNAERSMASTVAAFNAVYGTNLTEQQGWHFMLILKMVRQRAGGHIDSAEDAIAYASLAAECVHNQK